MFLDRPDALSSVSASVSRFQERLCPADWTQSELLKLLPKALSPYCESVAIFLDGLDEFDRDEDINILLNLLRTLAQEYAVKVCISSRPERRMHVELDSLPQSSLQDLTSYDIHHYVSDRLGSAFPSWTFTEVNEFVDRISRKADGVFLWVHLVVNSLLQGKANADDRTILLERLNLLPPDIEKLYEHMLKSLNGDENLSAYREQAALLLAFHDHFPMPLVDLTLATDKEVIDSAIEGRIDLAQVESNRQKVCEQCLATKVKIETRCAGLLEVVRDEWPATDRFGEWGTVQFFHRTARDFLVKQAAGRGILHLAPLPTLELVSRLVYVHLLKRRYGVVHPRHYSSTEKWGALELDRIYGLIRTIGILSSRRDDDSIAKEQCQLLEHVEFDYVRRFLPMWQYPPTGATDPSNWFLDVTHGDWQVSQDFWGAALAALGTKALTKVILARRPQDKQYATYLLDEMLRRFGTDHRWRQVELAPLSDAQDLYRSRLSAMQALLVAGANPSSTSATSITTIFPNTLWERFVTTIEWTYAGLSYNPIIMDTLEEFLKHGVGSAGRLLVIRPVGYPHACMALDEFIDRGEVKFGDANNFVISAVNVAFLLMLGPSSTQVLAPTDNGPFDTFLDRCRADSFCQNVAISREDSWLGWFEMREQDPDPFEVWDEINSEQNGLDEYDTVLRFTEEYGSAFSSDRQVQLATLIRKQEFATAARLEHQEGALHVKAPAQFHQHWHTLRLQCRLKRILITGKTYSYAYTAQEEFMEEGQVLLLHLVAFERIYGALKNSTVNQAQVLATFREFWVRFCSYYQIALGYMEGLFENDEYSDHREDMRRDLTMNELEMIFQEVKDQMRVHGLQDLSFVGQRIALREDGFRRPWCAQEWENLSGNLDDNWVKFWPVDEAEDLSTSIEDE